MRYDIQVAGRMSMEMSEQFADIDIRGVPDATVLSADIDQAALHGLLERIRLLGLELVDVRRVRPGCRAPQ
jgi:hypothetical protein